MEEEVKEIIRIGYFRCTLRKSDISVKRCIEFKEGKICSCPLGEAIRRDRAAVEKRFDFPEKKRIRTPKNVKLKDINPKSIFFIPSKKVNCSKDIIVYDTLRGYFSYDARVNTKREKIQVALVPVKAQEKTQKFLMEVNAGIQGDSS